MSQEVRFLGMQGVPSVHLSTRKIESFMPGR
jgi:hypothetical protein